MRFLVRRLIRTNQDSGQKEYQDKVLLADKLTIGRDSDQHLTIPDSEVALNHAEISINWRGKLVIRSLTPAGISVNGMSCMKSKLVAGNTIQVGLTTITVEHSQPGYSAVLNYERDNTNSKGNIESQYTVSLEQLGLKKSSWSWFLGIGVLLLFILIPLSGLLFPYFEETLRDSPILPDDNIWSSGPLNSAHQFIGKECNACHTEPFAMVKNTECQECHKEVQHHIDAKSKDTKIFELERCAECHREHNVPSTLVEKNPELCTDCHQKLDSLITETDLINVTDFGMDHPEFRFSMLRNISQGIEMQWESIRDKENAQVPATESSNLTFTHKDHLDPEGIETPDGDKIMVCTDCHQPDSSGRFFKPVIMDEHCSQCHSLLFDENDLNSKIPHGDLQLFFEGLTNHYSRVFLEQHEDTPSPGNNGRSARRPGGEAKKISRNEQLLALDWTQQQSLKIAEELIENRLCINCHEVSKVPGKTGIDQWKVKPIKLTQHWLPFANFDHASHSDQECSDCHHDVEKSEQSHDVLMPKIDDCRECHGGADEEDKIPSSCVMCHKFHLPKKGLYDAEHALKTKPTLNEKKSLTGNKENIPHSDNSGTP